MFITDDQKIVYKSKPTCCKNCGNKNISTYVFGEPNELFIEELKTNKLLKIGGCCMELGQYQKQWCCEQCNIDFYKDTMLAD